MSGSGVNSGGPTLAWVPDPNGRGTLTLLTSCLLTLGLCVWSAIQLDLPPRHLSRFRLWLLYLKWSILGVFGPELVVYVAWRQLNSARTLQREVCKAQNESRDSHPKSTQREGGPRQEVDWSLTHGFYGSMGGFVFDLKMLDSPTLTSCIPDLARLTLTARGVALLARCGLLPEISREEIEDKNKADHLAKTVVCVQATWFLIQTVARARQHLSVSLLEVMTLAHVVCALLVYLLWWNKPAMVREPVHLFGDWVPSLCAYMYMSSQISVWEHDRPGVSRRAWLDSELSALAYVKKMPLEEQGISKGSKNSQVDTCITEVESNEKTHADTPLTQYLQPRTLVSESLTTTQKVSPFSRSSEKVASPSVSDCKRWQLCIAALQDYPSIASRLIPHDSENTSNNAREEIYTFHTEELVTEYSSNWPSEHLLRGTRGLVMGIILWSATIGFGAIHLSAWNEHFPSVAEAWLWRVSALYIAGCGVLWMAINMLAKYVPWIDRFWDNVVALKVNRLVGAALLVICTFCGVLYVVSRLYLVVEAFISLRALPPSAYDTPDWTQLIPHF